ncbi:MAG: aminomethyl-transferring glycine dehydrogenase [Candidatus Nanopelagicales bacterium]|nr:aminomethyl-transferring glycine dehydrogenase [Candidatus Nanopelagicales bacterium]
MATAPLEKFDRRHIGPREHDVAVMIAELGFDSLDSFIDSVVPHVIRLQERLQLPDALTEPEAQERARRIAAMNTVVHSMIGMGYYNTHTPAVIKRNILENPAWYTSYTPYQPEISQGRLEALINFQTLIEDLTALPVAGASLLDEPTAVAEAMTLALRHGPKGAAHIVIDADVHPQVHAVLQTRAKPLGVTVTSWTWGSPLPNTDISGVILAYPGSLGQIRDIQPIITEAQQRGALAIVTTDLLSLTLLKPPGEMGADCVVGSAQRLGVPFGFGGPHAGFMSVRAGLERSLPGRLVGVSVDADGEPAYRLALQTREQHIRREKATSNICTAQVLLAVISGMYAAYHGPKGLTSIAEQIYAKSHALADSLSAAGYQLLTHSFFDTVTLVGVDADSLVVKALDAGINIRRVSDSSVSMAIDETTTLGHLNAIVTAFGGEAVDAMPPSDYNDVPQGLRRTSSFLTHPVFNVHHSETSLLRYMRKLSDKDIALDRSMIPLGSCTMKLNATTEMEPITWSEFANIHPFAPLSQASGYLELIHELESDLVAITGYDAVSLQPNAGSQGEFAGLLAIKAYHDSRGESHRDVCLIPSSAHGTNAASAVMAGLRVVVVACDHEGNVDVQDLREKIAKHGEELAALMITYPSTHGVFETAVTEICAMVHESGGQVYVDGANLNALVGLAQPGKFGADVSHLNLHKTFCIPHGGGGPGVGPVGVRAHLAPFLPSHPLRPECGPTGMGFSDGGVGPVSGAPWGSAGILPIPWAYIRMMGAEGLLYATKIAILSANYIAHRLAEHYPVLYSGAQGLVAHECILDIRPITQETGVSVDDIAKRLIDYGFHAPTMSFPVAGTLMIEPTESESLFELNRFCEAMIAIRAEIDQVKNGAWPSDNNPLSNAPHTASMLIDGGGLPYSAVVAAYPVDSIRSNKYWSPVRRIDGAFGDRNLVCSCPRPEELAAQ